MRCQITSRTTHQVLISKEISYKSYKEICTEEPKKVNIGFLNDAFFKVENNTMMEFPQSCDDFPHKPELAEVSTHNPCIYGAYGYMSRDWEVLSKFFSIHNIEPNWLDCNGIYGRYDEDLGGWTGCMGQV